MPFRGPRKLTVRVEFTLRFGDSPNRWPSSRARDPSPRRWPSPRAGDPPPWRWPSLRLPLVAIIRPARQQASDCPTERTRISALVETWTQPDHAVRWQTSIAMPGARAGAGGSIRLLSRTSNRRHCRRRDAREPQRARCRDNDGQSQTCSRSLHPECDAIISLRRAARALALSPQHRPWRSGCRQIVVLGVNASLLRLVLRNTGLVRHRQRSVLSNCLPR
jgi:hypothetical protein